MCLCCVVLRFYVIFADCKLRFYRLYRFYLVLLSMINIVVVCLLNTVSLKHVMN